MTYRNDVDELEAKVAKLRTENPEAFEAFDREQKEMQHEIDVVETGRVAEITVSPLGWIDDDGFGEATYGGKIVIKIETQEQAHKLTDMLVEYLNKELPLHETLRTHWRKPEEE